MIPEIIEKEAYARGYKDGADDAWRTATRIATPRSCGGIPDEDLREMFGNPEVSSVLRIYNPLNAMHIINNYKKRPKRRRDTMSKAAIKLAYQSIKFHDKSCEGCMKYEDPKYNGTYCCRTGTCIDNIEAYLDEEVESVDDGGSDGR